MCKHLFRKALSGDRAERWDRPLCSGGDKYNPLSNGACAASEAAVSRLGGVAVVTVSHRDTVIPSSQDSVSLK